MSVLLLASLAYYFYYFWSVKTSPAGLPMPEDSLWYLEYAYNMLDNFNLSFHVNDILYIGYNMLLVFLLWLFNSTETIVIVQTLCTALAVVLVYKIAFLIFNRSTAFLASLFYAFSLDLNIWTVYILSDSFFSIILLINIFSLIQYFIVKKQAYKYISLLSCIAVLFFRPNGLINFVFIVPWLVFMFDRERITSLFQKNKKILLATFTGIFLSLCFLLYLDKLDLFFESLHYNFKLLLYNVYAKGWIYDIDTKYTHKWFPNYTIIGDWELFSFIYFNWQDILVMMQKKAAVFLGYWVVYSDAKYKLSMFIFSIPTIFFAIGTVGCFVNKKMRATSLLFLTISSVFLFCIVFFVDSMYRYRAPVMPYIYIIMAYGLCFFSETIYHSYKSIKESLND